MQDIIKKIIEIDKEAQKMTEDALAEKEKAENSIEGDKKEMREKYFERAHHRIEMTSKTEDEFLKESLGEIEKKYAASGIKLNGLYESNHSQWANEIYKRVIGG